MVGGGIGFWTIYNTGVSLLVEAVDEAGSSSSSSATTKPTAVVTVSGSQVTVTATDATPNQGSGSNVAGIAAGTVVGIVAISGLVGAAFFLIRRRRNREIEEEHRRNAAVNAFINGSKPPGSSGSISGSIAFSDARLDPVMAQRRMSDGSIADNEDYSRRILRVCFSPCPWELVLLPTAMEWSAQKLTFSLPRLPMHENLSITTTNDDRLYFTAFSSAFLALGDFCFVMGGSISRR